MFCNHCGKENKQGDKYCVSCGKTIEIVVSKTEVLWDIKKLFDKRNGSSIKLWLKNIVLFICVYFLSKAIIDGIRSGYYYSDDNVFVTFALTILIIFVWNRLSKRFKF